MLKPASVVLALLAAAPAAATPAAPVAPAAPAPREATFEVRQEFTLTAPEGARRLRAWLTMPQKDPNQVVTGFKIEAPVPTRVETDSEGNTLVYLEASPPPRELKVVETFGLTRKEQRSGVDAARARPVSEADRKQYARYLQPNQNVIINDEVKALAAEITGGEQNPVRAARKLYDWTLHNVDYWVKYPDRMKASGLGSTEYCLKNRTGNCTDFHSL
jgi:transglutaminase-like putative cysteine protease